MLARVTLILFSTLLSGCSELYEPRPQRLELQERTVFSQTSSVRNTYVFDKGRRYRFCAEPSPDAGFTQQEAFGISVAIIGSGSEKGSEEESSGEIEFTGRVPHVLLARELLFRLCEFNVNHELSTQTAVDLYRKNLDIIQSVSERSASSTNITIQEALNITETEEEDIVSSTLRDISEE